LDKLILTSILLATVVLPVLAARGRRAQVSLRRALMVLTFLVVVYVALLTQVFSRFYVPEAPP